MPEKYPQGIRQWYKSLMGFSHIQKVFETYNDVKFAIAYNMHAKPLSQLLKYCHKKKIKVIADATEWYGNTFSLNPIKIVKWHDTNRVMKTLQKKVDGMIVISDFLKDYYRPFVKSIVKLPPLVDIEEPIWHQKPAEVSSHVEFTYAGVCGKDKDKIGLIIQCFSKINENYVFNVIGLTRNQFLDDYPELEGCLSTIGEKIHFHGRVSHSDSILALKQADYCIFIRDKSRKNMAGFPTKFVECYTTGIGIIVNDFSDVKDYFPLENSEFIEELSVDKIQQSILNAVVKGKVLHKENDLFNYKNYVESLRVFFSELE